MIELPTIAEYEDACEKRRLEAEAHDWGPQIRTYIHDIRDNILAGKLDFSISNISYVPEIQNPVIKELISKGYWCKFEKVENIYCYQDVSIRTSKPWFAWIRGYNGPK